MIKIFESLLANIDRTVLGLDEDSIQNEFEKIPLEIFGKVQIDRPPEFPNLNEWLPVMPSTEIQKKWNGATNHGLLNQSVAFLRTIINEYAAISNKPVCSSNILDFGCGWGRLIRLLYKYVPVSRIYGVDPWSRSIDICRETNVRANLYLSDYLPRTLPTPNGVEFNLILAFSVFTHLSEKAAKICLETLSNYLSDDGLLVITIRPIEYWSFLLKNKNADVLENEIYDLIEKHNKNGFAFYPSKGERFLVEGDITFGRTSMSLEYIKKHFENLEIRGLELNNCDPLQLIVFLTRKTK